MDPHDDIHHEVVNMVKTKKIRNKGKKPYIVKMPNEPNPLPRGAQRGIYIYRGGNDADPANYTNFEGLSLKDSLSSRLYGYDRRREFEGHVFRSQETLVNWINRVGFSATILPEGIFFDGYGTSNAEKNRYDADNYLRRYRSWMDGDVYTVATVEDPSVQEPLGETVYVDSPAMVPEDAVFVLDSFTFHPAPQRFTRESAEDQVRRMRADVRDRAERRYRFSGDIYGLTPEQAEMLGFDGRDMIVNEMYIVRSEGDPRYKGQMVRTKNRRGYRVGEDQVHGSEALRRP